MSNIKSKEGDDIYSITLDGYNSLDFVIKLCVDNEVFNINAPIDNQNYFYVEDSLYVKNGGGLKVATPLPSNTFNILSVEPQSWIDVLLMGYASFDSALKFFSDNDFPDLNRGLVDKKSYNFDKRYSSDPLLLSKILSTGTYYATGYYREPEIDKDGCFILTEDGYYFLQEDGFKTLVEICTDRYILQEDGFFILQEDGFKIYQQ